MRRISTWSKAKFSNSVFGKAFLDLGYDCFAVYCTAHVYEVPGNGWALVLERPQFAPQYFHAGTRHHAMMRAESEIAYQWSEYGIRRLVRANPAAFEKAIDRPGPIPVTDCKAYPFWKKADAIGPKPEPRYMQLLTEEARIVAKMPMGLGFRLYFDEPSKTDPELAKAQRTIQELEWGRDGDE